MELAIPINYRLAHTTWKIGGLYVRFTIDFSDDDSVSIKLLKFHFHVLGTVCTVV